MASRVQTLQWYVEKSKNNKCYFGICTFSCIICFATVLHLTDLTTETVHRVVPHKTNERHRVVPHNTKERDWTIKFSKFSLVILVLSAPANKERRLLIRQTWALNLPKTVKVLFVLGTKFRPHEIKTMLNEERKFNKDLIILPNLADTYKQLTIKTIESMKWINENMAFDYLLKIDDDTFVRVNEILNRLQWKPTERLYWGSLVITLKLSKKASGRSLTLTYVIHTFPMH